MGFRIKVFGSRVHKVYGLRLRVDFFGFRVGFRAKSVSSRTD